MQRKSILSALGPALVFTILASDPAAAVPVTFVSQQRYIHTYYMGTAYDVSAPDFAPFSAALYPAPGYVYATHDSTLGLTSTAHLYAHGQGGGSTSYAKYVFEVQEPVEYQFDATMFNYSCYDGWGSTNVSLVRAGGPIVFAYAGDLSRSGWLSAGTYTFEAWAGGSQGSQGGWGWGDLSFTLTLTPEPNTLILLGVTLAATLRRR